MKRTKSLVFTISLIISILFIVIISSISIILYNSTQSEVFTKFTEVGQKLRDVSNSNVEMIEATAALVNAGEKATTEEIEILSRILDHTIDDELVANAYFFSADFEDNDGSSTFTYLLSNEALRDIGLDTGATYEDSGTFRTAFKQAASGNASLTDVFTDEYGYWITYLAPIMNSSGEIVAVYGIDFDYNLVKERLNTLIWKTGLISIVSIFISVFIVIYILRKSLKPLAILVESSQIAAAGDLTVTVPVKANNEVGQAATAFNEMLEKLRLLVTNINDTSHNVTSSAEQLTQTAEEVKESAAQISSTMDELASGAESEANHASDMSENMLTFIAKINQANEMGHSIQEYSAEVLDMTNNGYEQMENSTKQMNLIYEIVRDAVEKVQSLQAQSHQISELVSVIQNVADQTNLLALNAAIEAARAGEQGKGFAVVADEVRKLAVQVSESVTDITKIVAGIQQETGNATKSLEDGYQEVEQGTIQITETGKTFNEISIAVEKMAANIKSVTTNLSDVTEETEQMNIAVQEIAAISEESAAGIEETTASSHQTSSSMEEVTTSSNELVNLAEELNRLVSLFKV